MCKGHTHKMHTTNYLLCRCPLLSFILMNVLCFFSLSHQQSAHNHMERGLSRAPRWHHFLVGAKCRRGKHGHVYCRVRAALLAVLNLLILGINLAKVNKQIMQNTMQTKRMNYFVSHANFMTWFIVCVLYKPPCCVSFFICGWNMVQAYHVR